MLRITLAFPNNPATAPVAVDLPDLHAPAFRSAINEIRDELGGRLAGAHRYDKEDALTRAASAIGRFAGAVNLIIPEGEKDYE